MDIIYTGEEMPDKITKSLFLAGPSLRPGQEKEMESWRNDAIKILQDIGYNGIVFIPENRDGKFGEGFDYDDQILWEEKYLNIADCIVFWIPRDLSLDSKGNIKLPAFTTNIEAGAWFDSGKVVFGAPKDAPKNRYLQFYADKYKVPQGESLTEVLNHALKMLGDGAERIEGERYVPLFIWNTPSFQSWYQAQTTAGNVLEHAELLYSFRPGFKQFVFLWILQVSVFITSENRSKTNEFVLARTDISSVLMWNKKDPINESEIVLVKEFRSPASTEDGFIYELPGGSSKEKTEPKETAKEEIFEETGLMIEVKKLLPVAKRQLCGTLSSHKSNLYSYQLNDEELAWLKSQKDIVHGNEEDSERTFIEVLSVKELLDTELTDWSNVGMILSIIYGSI